MNGSRHTLLHSDPVVRRGFIPGIPAHDAGAVSRKDTDQENTIKKAEYGRRAANMTMDSLVPEMAASHGLRLDSRTHFTSFTWAD